MSEKSLDAQARFDRNMDRSAETLARRELVKRASQPVMPEPPGVANGKSTDAA